MGLVILNWLVTILFSLSILSVPVSFLLERVVPTWKASKPAKIYKVVQFISFGVALLLLMIFIVLLLV